MKYYNGMPVSEGILLEKQSKPQQDSRYCTIFMTYDQLEKMWNRRNVKSGKSENEEGE